MEQERWSHLLRPLCRFVQKLRPSEIFLHHTIQWRICGMEALITASHAYSHNIYRVSVLVSMIASSIKLIDMYHDEIISGCSPFGTC